MVPTEARAPLKLGILTSHPIQYQAPLFRELARRCELRVFFSHRQTPQAQADAGFGVAFEWDMDLLSGYEHRFLHNAARRPDTGVFLGCDNPELDGVIQQGGFDAFLVMGWHLKSYWQALRACHRRKVPVMVRGDSHLATRRGPLKRALKAVAYPWVIRQFDVCLYVGQRNREYLEHYGAAPDRLFFAPHCVDIDAFATLATDSARETVRGAWGVAAQDQVLLYVGKLLASKRPQDLVEAATGLRSQGRPAVVVWVGDGPERARLEQMGAAQQVPMRFLGFCNQSQLPGIYAAADVLALPSAGETWGLVANEAMACGTPCVVSDACGCAPDMIRAGVTGAQYETGNTTALGQALASVLDAHLSPLAIKRHAERYSTRNTAAGILQAVAGVRRL